MQHRLGRAATRVLGIVLAGVLLLPAATAAAAEFTTPPGTGPISATLPLLGSSLTVDIATDDAGNLSSVALNPVGDFTASNLHPNAVKFEKADGSVSVTIVAWGGSSSVKARAGTLDALVGSGSWSGDVFKTGAATVVDYTIGKDADGKPTLSIDSVDAPGAIDATVGDVVSKSKGAWSSVRGSVEFAWQGFTKRLSIGVIAGSKHDQAAARLAVTLSGRKLQKVTGPLADVLGNHTWSGTLCDGTAVSIAFQVVDDGSGTPEVTYDPASFATGAEARAKDLRRAEGFVAFFKKHRAAVLVWLRANDDGTYDLVVGSFIGKWCKGKELANPTVNTPIDPDATRGWWGRGWWGWWNWRGHGHHGGWGGWGHRDHDGGSGDGGRWGHH